MVKDKISRLVSNDLQPELSGRFYLEIVLHGEQNNANGDSKWKLMKEITINLKEFLDSHSIVENAADLNLKLMKWRQVPDLDLLTP